MKMLLLSLVSWFMVLICSAQKLPDSAFIHYYPQISSDQGTDIFNFHLIPKLNSFNSLDLSNVLSKSSTLVLAFKSFDNKEKELLTLYSGKECIKFNNRSVKRNDDTICKVSDPSNGTILAYQFEFNKLRKKNGISCKEFITNADSSDALLEFYYIPYFLTTKERGIIESGLSIKYGISLFEDAMYYNSMGDTIWNSEKNTGFNHLVTGIGRDDNLNLNQKQSSNSKDQSLCIGFNNIENLNENNVSIIENLTYFLWGTNSSSQTIDNQGGLLKFKKQWKLTNHNLNSIPELCISASKEKIFLNTVPNERQDYWMVVYDSLTSSESDYEYYVKKDTIKESIVFSYKAGKGDKFISFMIAPKMFATYKNTPQCKGSNLSVLTGKIVGGISPYNICLMGVEKNNIHSEDGQFTFEKIQSGNHFIIVTDAHGNQYEEAVILEKTDSPLISIDSTIIMNGNSEVRIEPMIYEAAGNEYLWQGPNGFTSNSKDITAYQPGKFSCTIINKEGCESKYYVTVIDENLNEAVLVYPNPVLAGDDFVIEISTKETANIKISITDINGKIIELIQREDILFLPLKRKLFVRGTYNLNIEIGAKNFIRKIIVI